MIELLLLVGSIGFLVASVGAMIAMRTLVRKQQQVLERAQESHQLSRYLELTTQVQSIQQAWQAWEAANIERIEALAQQYEVAVTQWNIEHEVAQLPHVDDIPLSSSATTPRQYVFADWRPARLFRANLSGRDLSHRYLGYADLREAQLAGTNFYMADLSGACLAGANLTGADLSGANLSAADLRNAILTDANLLVADLDKAVLIGANLEGVRTLGT
jgi:Pentapeptide repeats (8 copies)